MVAAGGGGDVDAAVIRGAGRAGAGCEDGGMAMATLLLPAFDFTDVPAARGVVAFLYPTNFLLGVRSRTSCRTAAQKMAMPAMSMTMPPPPNANEGSMWIFWHQWDVGQHNASPFLQNGFMRAVVCVPPAGPHTDCEVSGRPATASM